MSESPKLIQHENIRAEKYVTFQLLQRETFHNLNVMLMTAFSRLLVAILLAMIFGPICPRPESRGHGDGLGEGLTGRSMTNWARLTK